MIPTLYGLRLINHLQLGSQNPFKLHEDIVKNRVTTLKWQTSLSYSSNTPLDMSPVLESAISKLAASRFMYAHSFVGQPLRTFIFYSRYRVVLYFKITLLYIPST